MSQHPPESSTPAASKLSGRAKQLLPMMAALIPVICGLGFHAVGPRPQTLKTTRPRLPLAFHQYMVNLGEVPPQRSHGASFSFTNHSEQAMELRRLETSCGCLSQQVEQKIIAPGERSRFMLWIQSASQSPGNKQYTCKAFYGPAGVPDVEHEADLVFRITLPEQSVVVTPKALIFHQPNSQVTEHFLEVTDLRFPRLRVVDATTRSKLVNVSVVPSIELTTAERDEGVVARVKVLVGAVPPGRHNAVVQILTSDQEFDVLEIPVLIHGPAATSDASVSHSGRPTVTTPQADPFD